jgi:hypothetical protein
MYYRLDCITCKETFKPIVATNPAELLYPDYDECEEQAGIHNRDALWRFHQQHYGHDLEAIKA